MFTHRKLFLFLTVFNIFPATENRELRKQNIQLWSNIELFKVSLEKNFLMFHWNLFKVSMSQELKPELKNLTIHPLMMKTEQSLVAAQDLE